MTAPSLPTPPIEELADSIFQVQHQPLLRAFLDNSSEGLGIVDAKGHPLFMNVRVRQILGIGFTDARPEEWSQRYGVFYPDSETLFPSEKLPLYRAVQGEQAPDQELFVRNAVIPEGRHFLARAWPVRDNQGQLLGAILILRDTEVERRAEAERRRTEQRFQRIVEAAQEGLWTVDAENRTTYVNRHAAAMLGSTPEEMLGRPFVEFVDPKDHGLALQELERQQRQGMSTLLDDFKLVRKDGTSIWTKISACPVHDELTGQYTGSLAIVVDITRRREAEAQVRQLNTELERRIAERTAQLEYSNRELEAFAYSVAHDLRAPLRSISNFTQALTEDCAGMIDATGRDYLQRIRASSQRMAELIDGILSLSRVNRTELVETNIDLSALARSITEQIQRWKPERTVNFQIQDGLVARGDVQLLRLVLENLLGNAWKFTREKPVAEIQFGVLPGEGGKRVYFVRDNGAGFDMEYQKKLFGVFQRLHTQQEFEGHGVGLATVQRIIRRHQGRVWGEGRVGEGATFYFTLHEETIS
ncbi:sensor histidine kinase [Archangium gephyra]|nr:PAS domain S-box protein [Archangium gephyra]AKJ03756.1 Phytochrome, two-component sensor histidine kinase [Archangium gephyra]